MFYGGRRRFNAARRESVTRGDGAWRENRRSASFAVVDSLAVVITETVLHGRYRFFNNLLNDTNINRIPINYISFCYAKKLCLTKEYNIVIIRCTMLLLFTF